MTLTVVIDVWSQMIRIVSVPGRRERERERERERDQLHTDKIEIIHVIVS